MSAEYRVVNDCTQRQPIKDIVESLVNSVSEGLILVFDFAFERVDLIALSGFVVTPQ